MSHAELDIIQTTEPLTVTEDGATFHLPIGTEGTIVYVHERGTAYEVEFLISPGSYGSAGEILETPVWCLATLTPDKLRETAH
jgi:hypothetical protein